jgi:hypothetical protein
VLAGWPLLRLLLLGVRPSGHTCTMYVKRTVGTLGADFGSVRPGSHWESGLTIDPCMGTGSHINVTHPSIQDDY